MNSNSSKLNLFLCLRRSIFQFLACFKRYIINAMIWQSLNFNALSKNFKRVAPESKSIMLFFLIYWIFYWFLSSILRLLLIFTFCTWRLCLIFVLKRWLRRLLVNNTFWVIFTWFDIRFSKDNFIWLKICICDFVIVIEMKFSLILILSSQTRFFLFIFLITSQKFISCLSKINEIEMKACK